MVLTFYLLIPFRPSQGFTCLLQISTREKDYIIDTLSLRDELHVLNEVFTDPKVLKVFHGADSDVEWLQRDLSIYVVNMFDTHQAAKRLGLARLSLAFLIKHYCDLELDKTFQLADWRIRPLPEELILYARLDTHYLLYVWDCMKIDLLKLANERTNLIQSVFQSSTNICKKVRGFKGFRFRKTSNTFCTYSATLNHASKATRTWTSIAKLEEFLIIVNCLH